MSTQTISTLRVALHADDPVSRAGLAAELDQRADLLVVDDGPADVAVLVAQEVDEPTRQAVRRTRRTDGPDVVLVVAHVDDQGLFAAVECGVSGLLRRAEATPSRLASAIHDASEGNGTLSGDLLGRLMEQVNHLQDQVLAPQGMHLNGLSDREIDVLRLVADGHTTCEIAEELCYSERTIKNVIQDITTRLNLRNRSHAVAYALRQGLI